MKRRRDGAIVVAGSAEYWLPTFALARFQTDGTLDTSFGSGGIITGPFDSRAGPAG